jgi:hypothetical protein
MGRNRRFGEMDDFGGSRGLGIVYEVSYPSGLKKYIAPYMQKDGKTRDAINSSSASSVRTVITQVGGKELNDADLNAAWAINWLKKYGGVTETATLVRNADSGAQLFPAVASVVAPIVIPGITTPSTPAASGMNWWDSMWADIKKALGIK